MSSPRLPQLKVQVWIYLHARTSSKTKGSIRVLLLRTTPKRGGFWQPVTGSVQPGETLLEAAKREASEETGLDFAGEPDSLPLQFTFESRGQRFCEYGFSLESVRPLLVKLDPREHVDYRWTSPEEAMRTIQFSSNADMLLALIRRLDAKGKN